MCTRLIKNIKFAGYKLKQYNLKKMWFLWNIFTKNFGNTHSNQNSKITKNKWKRDLKMTDFFFFFLNAIQHIKTYIMVNDNVLHNRNDNCIIHTKNSMFVFMSLQPMFCIFCIYWQILIWLVMCNVFAQDHCSLLWE